MTPLPREADLLIPSELDRSASLPTLVTTYPEQIFRQLYGEICWGVDWDSQLNLSMSFGAPHLRISEPRPVKADQPLPRSLLTYRRVRPRGEWWLWVFCSYWRLSLPDLEPVSGAAPQHRIRRALARLDGQKLAAFAIDPRTAATRFEFDLGAVLQVRRFSADDDGDMWTLYTPDQRALAVRGDGSLTHEMATEPEHWQPIRGAGRPSRPAHED